MTLDELAELALALPEVVEADRRGQRVWSVAGKSFAWERRFSKADIRRYEDAPVPVGDIVAICTADLEEKQAVLAAAAKGFFTIPHFDGYPAVLVELKRAGKKAVREALVDGWLACAPAELARSYAERTGLGGTGETR
jgi:hypothetical protein